MPKNPDEGTGASGNIVDLLWNSQASAAVLPAGVAPEYTNWRDEQLAWRRTSVLLDQSHHMVDLTLEGPGALDVLSHLGVNNFKNFSVNKAKQFVACNYDGYFIGDAILYHLEEEKYSLVGIHPVMNWVQYHLETGKYDLRYHRDDNSLVRKGDPELYRYQIQGPKAFALMEQVLGSAPPALKFFNMTELTIAGRQVRALRHGMAGEPGFELSGPWEDNEVVLEALLEAGRDHGLRRVGANAYFTTALESGWIPRPLPAIYTGDELAEYREWLGGKSYETTASLGGSFHSDDITDYYMTPYDLGYGRLVSFDHDFIGRDALERMVEDGRDQAREKVTLVWNGDDVEEAYGSMFHEEPGAKFISLPVALYATFQYDKVNDGNHDIGLSTWVGYSANERAILSLAVVDREFSKPGTELLILWGEKPNSRKSRVEAHEQRSLRVTVQPAPLGEYARTGYRKD